MLVKLASIWARPILALGPSSERFRTYIYVNFKLLMHVLVYKCSNDTASLDYDISIGTPHFMAKGIADHTFGGGRYCTYF